MLEGGIDNMKDIYIRSVNKLAYILINHEVDYDIQLDRYNNTVFVLEDTEEVRELKNRYEHCVRQGSGLPVDLVKFLDQCRELRAEIREVKGSE